MPSVFLSYSQTNIEQALLVERELTSRGLTVWRDQEQLRAGQRWPKALGEAIAASDAVLLLWSEEAAKSTFVELEWTTALALKKEILPCLIDDIPLPPSLTAVHAIPFTAVSEAVNKIVEASSHDESPIGAQANTKRVLTQLAGIRATNVADILQEFRTVHGSVYQAGRDIYIGTPPAKGALDKWQAWVAIIAGVLTAVTLGLALWHSYGGRSLTAKPQDAQNRSQEQSFAGSVWSAGGEPIPGVTVSLLLDGKLLDSRTTDGLGHFAFRVAAAQEAEITLIAQKDGFQTEKRYANLGNTNYNFKMSGAPK